MPHELVPLTKVAEHRPWCSTRFARRLVAERRIDHFKIGGKVFLALEDLDELAERGKVEAVR